MCFCVSDLFSFPLADGWGNMVSFSHPNYRYLGGGKKTPETHHTVLLRLTENYANIIFPLWDF